MDKPPVTPRVDHPLWSRFLRWCTLRPKQNERPSDANLVLPQPRGTQTEQLPDYDYLPLPSAQTYIRLATVHPGDFDHDIVVSIDSHPLIVPLTPTRLTRRLALVEVRKSLPSNWEAFQTIIDKRYFFRNAETGQVQWNHPEPEFHAGKYAVPPRNDGVFPKYETVSYVWGNPEKSATIRVEGPNGSYKLPATQSLVTALRYLRRKDAGRTLWIDAICLNQADYDELSHQVPRMHEIYGLSVKGTAWLGTGDAGSRHALEMLQNLSNQVVAEADTGLLFRNPDATQDRWFDPDVKLPFDNDAWGAILALLQRPWFNRLWVVQEIQPGAVVQCGHETIPIAAFTEAIYCLYAKTRVPQGMRLHLEQATGTLARLPSLSFTRLLYRASTFKSCGDPRDKIYGLLGLAPRKFAASIEVKYEEHVTATDVYTMACLNHAAITRRLEHFHNCFSGGGGTSSNEVIMGGASPSWVPDWYSDVPAETYIPPQFATGVSRAHYTVSDEKKVLRVRGLRCGIVSAVSEPLPPRLGAAYEAIRRVRKWQPEDLDSAIYHPTGEPLRKAYAITLLCNSLKEREPDWILSSTDEWVGQDFDQALFGDRAADDNDVVSDGKEEPGGGGLRSDVADALQCCGGRLFFRTEEEEGKGYIGLAPADTKSGDVVAIVLGASNPLVLRPALSRSSATSSEACYSVVGECFVHGLHDSTALLGPLPQPWTGFATWVVGDRRCLRFLNTETGEVTLEDPRLETVQEWERIEKAVDGDDPILFDFFKHKVTGEVINWDPRLEPEELDPKRVALTWLSLV